MPEQGVPCNSRGRVDHRSRPPPRPRAHSRMVKSRVWRKSHHISFFNPDAPPNPPGPFTRLRQWSTQAETTRTHRLYYIQVPPPLPAPAVVFTIPIPPPHPPTPPRITFLWASRRNRFPTRFNTGLVSIIIFFYYTCSRVLFFISVFLSSFRAPANDFHERWSRSRYPIVRCCV